MSAVMEHAETAGRVARSATPLTFDLWADVYDDQANPLLSLEHRILSALLPDLEGREVLDAGCGTGRLFDLLQDRRPRRLIGVDSSPAMLARAKERSQADVREGSCMALPVSGESMDCVVGSFVVSYIVDLQAFASEIWRVTRPGASVVLSDMHPETARRLGWKRSFTVGGAETEVACHNRRIEDVCAAFVSKGFVVAARVEPAFAVPEANIFERAGRAAQYGTMKEFPAIYIVMFTKAQNARHCEPVFVSTSAANGRCALTPHDAVQSTLTLNGERVARIETGQPEAGIEKDVGVDLSGYLVLPGLINAHDHLEFGLFPRLGHRPYGNAREWAEDIQAKDADLIRVHRSIPRDVRVWWGAIRNLLCGVTTVCHHNPLSDDMLSPDFPVQVVRDFDWAHSLGFDAELRECVRGVNGERPFIVHAAEGVDAESESEFQRLEDLGVVNGRAVIVHGLALSAADVAKMNACGSGLICCPSSNEFLFERTLPAELLSGLGKSALGSDSPLTAVGDLLDELRFAREHVGLAEADLYTMVTTGAAALLQLRSGEGRIAPETRADMLVTRDPGLSPAKALVGMSFSDVEMVIRSGRVFLVGEELYVQLGDREREGLEKLTVNGERCWIRAPLERLFAAAAAVISQGALMLGGKRVTHGHDA